MKKLAVGLAVVGLALAGCASDADVVGENLSKDADNFKINRKITFINGITDKPFLEVAGFCNINDDGNQLEVVCDTPYGYLKHFLGLSDNVTYVAEQLDAANVSKDHYKVILNPSVIIPDVERR